MSESNESLFDLLLDELFKSMWRWRLELALLTIAAGSYYVASLSIGRIKAAVLIGVTLSAITAPKATRRYITSRLDRSRQRRRLHLHLLHQVSPLAAKPPVVKKVQRVRNGIRMEVQLSRGTSLGDLEKIIPNLAVSYKARKVKVVCDENNASIAYLTIVRRNPFAKKVIPFPHTDDDYPSIWDPIPLGIDEDGETVTLTLPENHVLAGGASGSGKSSFQNVILTRAALSPDCGIFLFDGKGVDLAPWKPIASHYVGMDVAAGVAQLDRLIKIMDGRYGTMAAHGMNKVERESGWALILIVIDELPFYVANPNTKTAKEFAVRLRDLIARGRAAGIMVAMTAQKPSADTIPSFIRDLVNIRIAFRCSTREASDTILGGGWASQNYSANQIPLGDRGVGFLLGDMGLPLLFKCYFLDSKLIQSVVTKVSAGGRPGLFGVSYDED